MTRPFLLRRTSLSQVALVLYALALAAALGLGSAWWSTRGRYPLGQAQVQTWAAWPQLGSRSIDPYARAILARTAEIPLGVGEGLPLMSSTDETGEPLRAECTYRIAGVTPAARFWTLTLTDEAGKPVVTPLERASLTSSEILRAEDGRFDIVLSRGPQPGNWLQMPETGRVRAVLRLYDTPVAGSLNWLDPGSLPAVQREACAS